MCMSYAIEKVGLVQVCEKYRPADCAGLPGSKFFATGHFCGICRRQCHYEFNTVF